MLQQEQIMMDMTLRELLDVVSSYYPAPYTPEEVMEITNTGDIADMQYMRLSDRLEAGQSFTLFWT
jgi:hypothetical protein